MDKKLTFTAVKMHAQGSITYNTPVGADFADGTITVTDYLQLIAAKAAGTITFGAPTLGVIASGSVTVVDYTLMGALQSAMTITIDDYTLLGGETVTVDGNALVEGVDWTAATSNDATATSLASAIDGIGTMDAAAVTDTVTVEVTAAGVAGDGTTVTSTDEVHMTLSAGVTSGGRDAMTITVNGNVLTANSSFTAETSNDVTATNLEVAIEALSDVNSTVTTNVVTVNADVEGTAANSFNLLTSFAGAATVSGATLTGGIDGDTVVVNGTTLTAVTTAPSALEFTNITELEVLVEAIASIDASEDGTDVTVTAATAGEAGNALTLALGGGNTGTMSISGAVLTGGQDNASFNVDGTTLTNGTEFTAVTDNDTTAAAIATAADLISGVGAASVTNVCTITDDVRGVAANSNVLTQDVTGGSSVSGSGTFTGGVDGDTVTVSGTLCTNVVGSAGANEFSTITELEVLVEAIAAINSTEDGTTVSINADAVGTGGNAITLALGGSNAGDMAISGATLSGGAAAIFSEAFQLPPNHNECDIIIIVDSMGGGSPTLDAVPEGSANGGDDYTTSENAAESALAFTQFTSAGTDKQYVQLADNLMRVKITLGGTSPSFTGEVVFTSRGT